VATAHGVSSINLLPKDSFDFSTTGKALKWATTVGRVLVVLTEFVVLLAFASRFYFDKKLSDLGDVLVQKEAQIAAYADVETSMRKILAKEAPIETAQKDSLGFANKFDGLTRIMPVGTTLDSLSLSGAGLAILGRAQSEYGFAQLIAGIKKMPNVKTINMKDTSFDQTTAGVKFNMVINFK
jgi:Tfp pilus assembly protein PilN